MSQSMFSQAPFPCFGALMPEKSDCDAVSDKKVNKKGKYTLTYDYRYNINISKRLERADSPLILEIRKSKKHQAMD